MSLAQLPIQESTAPERATKGTNLPFDIAPSMPHIREYRNEDAEEVARMWRESASAWPGGGPGGGEDASAAQVIREQAAINTLGTFIGYLPDPETGEERAVGYCSLFDYPSEASTAYVGILSAHPAWHGKGVGRDLLKAALERTVAQGYTRLDLNTWAGNLKAVPLYKKSGYFWVPETTVKMENYLPAIFLLPIAQQFFQHADWYRDFRRDLSVREDLQQHGKLQVYTYAWEHEGRRLRVVIDRRAKGIVELETEAFAVATEIDEPKLPIGGQRTVTWRVHNHDDRPVQVTVLAEGEDCVRCTYQASGAVEREQVWSATATAEQPQGPLPVRRPANRIKSTVVVDGQPVPLALSTQVRQPVDISFDRRSRIVPGRPYPVWITAENGLDETIRGEIVLSASMGLDAPVAPIAFDLGARQRLSRRLDVRAAQTGTYTLGAQASVTLASPAGSAASRVVGSSAGSGGALHTKIYEHRIHCAEPGDTYIERDDDRISVVTDRLVVSAALRPGRGWSSGFSIGDRISGQTIVRQDCSLGPPFMPSPFVNSVWSARVEQTGGRATLVLSTAPDTLPGITFERIMQISPSGLVTTSFGVTNTGAVPRTLEVMAGTSFDADGPSKVAAPLASGLVVEDSNRFPDWDEPDLIQPDRYAESWMAEFGEQWVGATFWTDAKEVSAAWSAPSLVMSLGEVGPGQSVRTSPVYLFAGNGDWRTARALWRELINPDAADIDPEPDTAHSARLERIAFENDQYETAILLRSERYRPVTGTASLEVDGQTVSSGPVEALSAGRTASVAVHGALPARAGATPATIVLDHQRSTDRYESALLRLGVAGSPVTITSQTVSDAGQPEQVRIDNGRLRLAVSPKQMGRVTSLEIADASGEWRNQLLVSPDQAGMFVWFNPWFGGMHPSLSLNGADPASKLFEESFAWHEVQRTGAQGIHWRGVALSTDAARLGVQGLRLTVEYLTTGQSNVLAIVSRLENGSAGRLRGDYVVETFLRPGDQIEGSVLHYERFGPRTQKRVHGGMWSGSGQWCAVEAPGGSPVIAAIGGTANASVSPRDMGLNGVHPNVRFPVKLDPGQTLEGICYLVLAEDVAQARLYRFLSSVRALP